MEENGVLFGKTVSFTKLQSYVTKYKSRRNGKKVKERMPLNLAVKLQDLHQRETSILDLRQILLGQKFVEEME